MVKSLYCDDSTVGGLPPAIAAQTKRVLSALATAVSVTMLAISPMGEKAVLVGAEEQVWASIMYRSC